MILELYEYVEGFEFSGHIENDVKLLLQNNGKYKTFTHVTNVAQKSVELAEMFDLDVETCRTGGYLHDISAVISPADMLQYAVTNNMTLCEAERKYPFLLHQRMSRIVAKDHFCISDEDVLSAIECHTTLKNDPSKYEMVLFIADKLAWDQEGIPPFYNEVSDALNDSLERACYMYMKYMNDNGKVLCPHTNWTTSFEWLKNTLDIKG